MERALRDIIANEDPDVIVGDAFAAEDAVREVAKEFPDTAFVFGSGGEEQAPNFSVFDNWLQDPAYLAGMMAGGLTKTGTVGVVGAMPIPEVNRIVNAFTAGAQESKPDAKVTVSFINSFFDPATAKQAAEAAIAGGADVLFAERDGVIAAAEEHGLPVFGMMVDQKDQAPEHVVSSLVWDMRPTIEAVVDAGEGRQLRGAEPGRVLLHEERRQLAGPDQHRDGLRDPGRPDLEGRGAGGRDQGRQLHHPGERGRAGRLHHGRGVTPADDARGGELSPPRAAPLVELRGITKRFGSLLANDAIDLSVDAGEVLALLGENGAGKSTLTRILYGLSRADAGEIRIAGQPVTVSSPADALAAGVGMVTQEFTLVGPMTVTENLMLAGSPLGRVDRKAARARVLAASERLGVPVDPDAVVERLSVGERQRVEILKALLGDCRVLVLDEPTAVLVPADVELLFASIRRLTADGMAVVFISHKLHEVVDLADRISILRRGKVVADLPAEGLDPAAIAALMVGATAAAEVEDEALATAVGLDVAPEPAAPAPVVDRSRPAALEVQGLTLAGDPRPRVDDVSLTVRAGEIVGVAGVSGNGQTELVALLCGTTPVTAGTVHVGGIDVTRLDVAARLRAGLGRLTEDRRGSVVLGMSVEQNLVLEDLDRFRTGPFLSRRRVRAHAESLIERFDIRAAPADPVRSLSGGNMQKVLLARAIERDPTVLVASQPTRGLDVGACEYVYGQLRALREAGSGVLLVSEDLDELIGIADRIVVLSGGRLVGEVAAADATREALGVLMTGGPREQAA